MTRLSLPAYDQLSTDQKRVYDDIAAGPRGSVRGLWQYGLTVQNWPMRHKAWDGIVDTTAACPKNCANWRF